MKSHFKSYYRLNDEQFSALWQDCVFVLDANVLLNLYRYSAPTRNELLSLLKSLATRLWLPHQAALEFHRNRLAVISSQEKDAEEFEARFTQLVQRRDALQNHLFLSPALQKRLTKLSADISKHLTKVRNALHGLLTQDTVLLELTALFEGRVGEPFSEERQQELLAEGEQRYKRNIPPGFEDRHKDGRKKFGDLFLWMQILDYLRANKRALVLVTDDAKADWWRVHNGDTVGPLPALREEAETFGASAFYMYHADQFMSHAKKHLNQPVNEIAVQEARNARTIVIPRDPEVGTSIRTFLENFDTGRDQPIIRNIGIEPHIQEAIVEAARIQQLVRDADEQRRLRNPLLHATDDQQHVLDALKSAGIDERRRREFDSFLEIKRKAHTSDALIEKLLLQDSFASRLEQTRVSDAFADLLRKINEGSQSTVTGIPGESPTPIGPDDSK